MRMLASLSLALVIALLSTVGVFARDDNHRQSGSVDSHAASLASKHELQAHFESREVDVDGNEQPRRLPDTPPSIDHAGRLGSLPPSRSPSHALDRSSRGHHNRRSARSLTRAPARKQRLKARAPTKESSGQGQAWSAWQMYQLARGQWGSGASPEAGSPPGEVLGASSSVHGAFRGPRPDKFQKVQKTILDRLPWGQQGRSSQATSPSRSPSFDDHSTHESLLREHEGDFEEDPRAKRIEQLRTELVGHFGKFGNIYSTSRNRQQGDRDSSGQAGTSGSKGRVRKGPEAGNVIPDIYKTQRFKPGSNYEVIPWDHEPPQAGNANPAHELTQQSASWKSARPDPSGSSSEAEAPDARAVPRFSAHELYLMNQQAISKMKNPSILRTQTFRPKGRRRAKQKTGSSSHADATTSDGDSSGSERETYDRQQQAWSRGWSPSALRTQLFAKSGARKATPTTDETSQSDADGSSAQADVTGAEGVPSGSGSETDSKQRQAWSKHWNPSILRAQLFGSKKTQGAASSEQGSGETSPSPASERASQDSSPEPASGETSPDLASMMARMASQNALIAGRRPRVGPGGLPSILEDQPLTEDS